MDEHGLVSALKQLALELGRTPTQAQFSKMVTGSHKYRIYWPAPNSWNKFVQAAGLAPTFNPPAKITNEVFKVDINEHLDQYVPKIVKPQGPWPSIASISDIHWPFSNKKVIDRFLEYVGDEKPKWVIINGDAFDMYSHSRFPRSHNIFTPEEEENRAKAANLAFWKEVRRRLGLPEVPVKKEDYELWQLMGNHDIRPIKQVLTHLPTIEHWAVKYMKELFTFPGVTTEHDHRQELMIGNIAVFHGYRSKLGEHRDFMLCHTMNGHTHKGGVSWRRVGDQNLFELNSGLAGDPQAKGLTYTPQKSTDQTPGFSNVNKYGPQFVSV
jgi:predicted phosphodiesterase